MDDDDPRPSDRSTEQASSSSSAASSFRLLLVPGTTPGRWVRTWRDRRPGTPLELVHATVDEQVAALREGRADVGLVRLAERPADLSAIPLYTEASVVVVPKGHLVTAAEEVTAADLVDETLLVPADDVLGWVDRPGEASLLPAPPTTADAVELVAAGAGVLVVPQSLARLHDRKDLVHRPVTDAPTSTVHLAWVTERTTPDVETFVGIVRGRTANSSREPAPERLPEAEAGGARRGAAQGGPRGTTRRGGGGSSAGAPRRSTGADRGRSRRGPSGGRGRR
ncbi:LysR family substrate-binding domain-containing protein [Actinotalea sp. Marseille-Q4924]|uniref:LysR family substrate-binding domain-containing protein n=1 Tax=Actinotalea sp. Marseille-Q4924 TaxID=2866571 RepID=UPI001CE49AFE|nr:LysR family substrate-binding domain-containing protein [Actinotalea sp. Marseille-Q4924]